MTWRKHERALIEALRYLGLRVAVWGGDAWLRNQEIQPVRAT